MKKTIVLFLGVLLGIIMVGSVSAATGCCYCNNVGGEDPYWSYIGSNYGHGLYDTLCADQCTGGVADEYESCSDNCGGCNSAEGDGTCFEEGSVGDCSTECGGTYDGCTIESGILIDTGDNTCDCGAYCLPGCFTDDPTCANEGPPPACYIWECTWEGNPTCLSDCELDLAPGTECAFDFNSDCASTTCPEGQTASCVNCACECSGESPEFSYNGIVIGLVAIAGIAGLIVYKKNKK